jgi:hypothetical protein
LVFGAHLVGSEHAGKDQLHAMFIDRLEFNCSGG